MVPKRNFTPRLTPEQMRDMKIYGDAMTLMSGRDPYNGDYTIDGEAVAAFMKLSPLHEQYIREFCGTPEDWERHDNYHDLIGWICTDPPTTEQS